MLTCSVDMTVSEKFGIAASKGNQMLGLIRRTITYKENQQFGIQSTSMEAISLEGHRESLQAWRPYR